MAWAIAAAVGAAAGAVIAPIDFAVYDAGAMFGLKGCSAAVLGGLGSAPGAVIGGLMLGILEMITAGFAPSGYKDAVAFVLLLVVLSFRPGGLLGSSLTEAEA